MTMRWRDGDKNGVLLQRTGVALSIVWTSIITGCWSAGLRSARSPGVTTPHFVSSNGLGDRVNFHPTHVVSPDYDALLANVNGDYGIKSAVIRAAGEEPEYKGADTLVVPLYIPEGAVPIRLARIARSGTVLSESQNPSSIRVQTRRARVPPAVTSRRQGGPRRPTNPTLPPSPPSFLKGWGRRIAPRADSRVGLHDDSDTGESQAQESKLQEEAKIRSYQNSRQSFGVTSEIVAKISNDSSQADANFTSSRTSTTAVPVKHTTLAQPPLPSILTSTDHDIALDAGSTGEESVSNSNAGTISNITVSIPLDNRERLSASEDPKLILNLSSTSANHDGSNSESSYNFSRQLERRLIRVPAPVQDNLGQSNRTTRTATSGVPSTEVTDFLKTGLKDPTESDNDGPRIPSASRSRPILFSRISRDHLKHPEVTNEDPEEEQSDSSSNIIANRRLPFPPRPASSARTQSEKLEIADKRSVSAENNNSGTVTTKFQMTLLARKSASNNRKNSKSHADEDGESKSTQPTIIKNTVSVASEISTTQSTLSPTSAVTIPIRRRRPLRPTLTHSQNPVPNFSSLSTIPTTTFPTTTQATTTAATTTTTVETPTTTTTTTSTTTSTAAVTTTASPTTTSPTTTTSTTTTAPHNPPTTTASSVRRIHEFFKISPNRNRQITYTTKGNNQHTTVNTAQNVSSHTTPTTLVFPSTHIWHNRPSLRTSSVSLQQEPASATTPSSSAKSPAEIVLASLSAVMKNATSRDKDRFKEIATDLDTLNKQLAARGILIIHAEIDGHIIKLRNHTKNPNATSNSTNTTQNRLELNDDALNEKLEHFFQSQAQSLSSTDDSITTVFTPSDHLEYDLVLKNDGEIKRDHDVLSSTYYNIQNANDNSDNQNEVSTTKFNKVEEFTTSKPSIKFYRTSSAASSLGSTPRSTEYDRRPTATDQWKRQNERLENRAVNSSLITTRRVPIESIRHSQRHKDISATATIPSTDTTRSRTTTVSVTEKIESIGSYANEKAGDRSSREEDSTGEYKDVDEALSAKTTSHLRPKISDTPADVILEHFVDTSNSPVDTSSINASYPNSLQDKNFDRLLIEEILLAENEINDPIISSTDDDQALTDAADDEETSSVYLVGIIGIFPLAGVAAYIIRKFLRGDTHQKALPESEERPDGFTPPTHHHSRPHSHSLLPPVPEPKLLTPASSTHTSKGSTCDIASIGTGLTPPLPTTTPWELTRSKLRLVSVLGEGNFGVVWKAEARGFFEYAAGGVLVAVKKVKDNAGAKEKCDLLRELAVMQLLGPHPNVVSLLGCCTQTEPHLVIMEYVMFGKLLTFLRDHRTRHNYFNFSSDTAALTSRDLTKFACQVANGCDYLQSKGIIHRDLAARNILVDHNKVCKIADFGMARSIQDIGSDIYEQKSKGALPIRWMAPESLYMNIFTHKSDVWSFGILCWEIVTLGATPYPGLTAREVMRQVTEGYRLERPEHCRPELYRLLATCWQQDLNKRPTFHQLNIELNTLLEHQTGYIDLENFPEEDYFSMHQNNDEKL